MIYTIPDGRLLAVRRVVGECANFVDNECVMFGECFVKRDSYGIICKYYMQSVLPMDAKLHQEILLASEVVDTTKKFTRKCKQCGVKFKAVAKQTMYCEKCEKKRNAERLKKAREKKRAKKG